MQQPRNRKCWCFLTASVLKSAGALAQYSECFTLTAASVVSCSAELQRILLREAPRCGHFLSIHGIGVLNAQNHTHNTTQSLSTGFDTRNMHLQKTDHSLLHFFFFNQVFDKSRVQVNWFCSRFLLEIQFAELYEFHSENVDCIVEF